MTEKSQKDQKKSPSESKESKSSPPECPFARNGVVEALHKLTDEDGLLVKAVFQVMESNALMKESNQLSKTNSRMLRLVILMFLCSAVVLLAVGALAYLIFEDVVVVEQNMGKSISRQEELVTDVKKLVEQQKKTDEKLDDAKEALEAKPTLELVPEPDPEKAKAAPLKVRITAPTKPSKSDKPNAPPPPAPATVEVPLPVKDAKSVKTSEVVKK